MAEIDEQLRLERERLQQELGTQAPDTASQEAAIDAIPQTTSTQDLDQAIAAQRKVLKREADLVDFGDEIEKFNPALKAADDLVRSTAQTLTFEFGDEIFGRLNSLVTGRPVEDEVARERLRTEMITRPARIGGLVLGEAAKAFLVPTSWIEKGGLIMQSVRGALLGATEAGLTAAGAVEGEEAMERIEAGITAAPVGMVTGGAAPSIVAGGRRLLQAGARMIPGEPSAAVQAAVRKISKELVTGDTRLKSVIAQLERLGPGATLSEASGHRVAALADIAVDSSDTAARRSIRTLFRRRIKQNQRVGAIVQSIFDRPTATPTISAIVDSRAVAARELYKKAGAMVDGNVDGSFMVTGPQLSKVITKNEEVRSAIQAAKRSSAVLADLPPNNSAVLDAAFQNLPRGTAKSELKKALFEANPAYKEAVEAFAGSSALIRSMENGRKVFTEDAAELGAQLGKLSAGEKEMFLIGASKAIMRKIETSSSPTKTVQDMLSGKQLNVLKEVFPNATLFAKFKQKIRAHGTFEQTFRKVLAATDSAVRRDALQKLGLPAELAESATMGAAFEGPKGMLVAPMRGLIRLGRRGAEKTQEEVARGLTTTQHEANVKFISRLAREIQTQAIGRRAGVAGALATGGAVGQQVGTPEQRGP